MIGIILSSRHSARPSLFVVLALCVGLTALPATASQRVARTGGEFGPDSKSSRHPKKLSVEMTLPSGFGGSSHRLCTDYSRTATSQSGKGSLTAKVTVARDGAAVETLSVPKANVSGGRASGCTTASTDLEEGDVVTWAFTFKKMPKIPAGDSASFAGEVIRGDTTFGRFLIAGDNGASRPFWIDGPGTVFCSTDAGFADLWIRFASDSASNGENAPHIDIDVCGYAGGGSHSPLDPQNPSCSGGKRFDIFWHDAAGDAYFNAPNASECELTISDGGDTLEGSFSCAALSAPGLPGTVDVLGGAFLCPVD